MEDAIEALLNKYLSHYKTYQTIFYLMTVIIVAIINVLVAFYLKSRIEKVRLKNSHELSSFISELNLFNKKSEIKFQKYHLEQAEIIKELYSKLIEIIFSTNSLFNESSYKTPHHDFKDRLTTWVKNYWAFYTYYCKNRILIDNKLIDLIDSDINSLNKIYSIIFKKSKEFEELEQKWSGQAESVYSEQYDKEGNILKELRKLRKEAEDKESTFKFSVLLSNLEKEYVNLLK